MSAAINNVKLERLRLCQRLLIGALEADPSLNTDDQWQAAMATITALVQNETAKRKNSEYNEPRVTVKIEQGSGRIKDVEVVAP